MALEYFTEAELRAVPQMSDAVTYKLARVEAAEAYIVDIIERVIGTSFIARTVTDEVHDGGGFSIRLNAPYVLSVTSATENGVAVTSALSVVRGVAQKYATGASAPTRWADGCRSVKITYQAGYSAAVPGDIKEAALKGTRAHLLATNSNAGVDDRRTSMNTELGTIQYVVAGEDRPTGYPEVDAVIMGYLARLGTHLGIA